MHKWNEITDENSLKEFMERVSFFHDSCIKEMHYLSGAYVNENLDMYPVNDRRILRVIIQRQYEEDSMIEMEFQGLKYLKLFPEDERYSCEILDSNIILKEDCIIWSDCEDKTGRLMMKEVEGSEYKVDVELVLIAAGFLGSENYVTKAFGVETNARTNVATAEGSHKTNVENVFVTGDMHRGQSLVVWAIREGRDVAKEVDESLMGYTNL